MSQLSKYSNKLFSFTYSKFDHKLHMTHLENWNKHYKENSYKFASRDNLFDIIDDLVFKA